MTTTDAAPSELAFTDAELEELALSLPRADVAAADAAPDTLLLRRSDLPVAYLPGAMPGPHRRWHGPVAIVLIAAFLTITALGFCVTYGQISFA